MISKICKKCKLNKNICFFVKDKNICKECKKEYLKKYYKNNSCKIKKLSKKYKENNKEKVKCYQSKYKKDNKEVISTKNRIYRVNNVEKVLLSKAKYRANKKGIPFNITLYDVKNIMPKNNICPFLGIKMCISFGVGPADNSFSLDRIDSNKGYTKENIQVISNKANTSKSNLNVNQYKTIVNNLERIIKFGVQYNYEFNGDLKSNFNNAKRRAKKYNIPFDIKYEDIKKIYPINGICPLLNIEIKKGKNIYCEQSPSLDRIFPDLGYVEGNIIIISFKANLAKNNLSLEEMKSILEKWMVINGKRANDI